MPPSDPRKSQQSNTYQEDDKYHNLDYIKEVLEENDRAEQGKVMNVQGWTEEELKLYGFFAKLRKEAVEKASKETEERELKGDLPTEEEFSAGAFRETIEPQVRDAVFLLREKGYNTYESGFYDFNSQMLSFHNHVFRDQKILKEFEKNKLDSGLNSFLKKNKAELIITSNSIRIIFNEYKDAKFIKNLWKKINNCLPDLGEPAKESSLPQAKNFRERYLDKNNNKN